MMSFFKTQVSFGKASDNKEKMPILIIMKLLFSILMILCVSGLFAAPLEGGYALAPRSSASNEEKAQAYMNARKKVIEAAKKYLGVPYRYGGMTTGGLDCSGFICLSFQDALNVSLPRSAAGLYTWTDRIPLDKAQPGDFLFFRTGTNNNITHVGIYLGNRRFIHAASAGQHTGVIYSSLNEQYYERTYAGAGRAFPEAPASFTIDDNTSVAGGSSAGAEQRSLNNRNTNTSAGGGHLLAGIAAAPIWNGFIKGGELVRGVSSQFFLYADTGSLGARMVFGLELRPEYDGALGIFNLPITLSWGPNDKIRIFAGPVLCIGDAVLTTESGDHYYSRGTSWLATIGITAAPFAIKSPAGDFTPYIEVAWQSYISDENNPGIEADFAAGFRFSTGLRWLIKIK